MQPRLGDGVNDIGQGGTSKEILEELRAVRMKLEKRLGIIKERKNCR